MADEKKIGVYLCSDCGIGEALDIEELEKVATSEFKVPVCKKHPFLCSREGVQVIKDDINNGEVNKIVIAACSPRVNTDASEKRCREGESARAGCLDTAFG